jgi:CDGSH iron-sulfur domain-containing protein 3
MVRYVKKEDKGPVEVKFEGVSKWICMCGLSDNQPFCDGAHKKTLGEEEGKVYRYNTDGTRTEIQL